MSANNIHLTQTERLNLKNLGVNVKLYGAIGDGNADDTSAFTAALENNKRVYVPGGTYKISGELVVYENCELKLARDAVLYFYSETNEVIPETFNCITLSSSSRLIGNHATICVHYEFKGNVIRIAANPEDDTSCKSPRYLKDINIVKIIENGDHTYSCGSIDNVTNGTALLIEGTEPNETENPSILWGVEALGIRIAGAFDYGIKCINTNYEESGKTAWKYETSIDALIDGCRTGLYMDHYNNARISAVIKTRQAYRVNLEEDESLKYAEHGIHLVNCKYIDLRSSRIIDKDPKTDNLTVSNEFKHINLDGVCRGLMIENSLCSRTNDFNIRDYIHTNVAENFDSVTILGEPSSRYIDLNTENYYDNLNIDKKICTSVDEGVKGSLINNIGTLTTDFIKCTNSSIIKTYGFEFDDLDANKDGKNDGYNMIVFYDEDGDYLNHITAVNLPGSYFVDYYPNEDGSRTIKMLGKFDLKDVDLIRFCCDKSYIHDGATVTVDGNIIKYKKRYLEDGIYIKDPYIKSLGT